MLNHGLLMLRSHFEVILLAELRLGVGRRDPVETVAGIAIAGRSGPL